MNKRKSHAFGKDIYLLGKDSDDTLYWLEQGKWDCNWYWGCGYVETYTNNKNPEKAKDISSHYHFDGLFFKQSKINGYDAFREFFVSTPLNDKEIWELLDLMKCIYSFKELAEIIHRGSSNYTTPIVDVQNKIKNEEVYKWINFDVIPFLLNRVYILLSPSEVKDEK